MVSLPPGKSAITSKWVYRLKRDATGHPAKYKARLVARGFLQKEGVDYSETFAPVAKFTSIRILLSMAAVQDYEIHQMDVKTAFLNGFLQEEVFMHLPQMQDLKVHFEKGKVAKLNKSLYGLKQAPRSWYDRIHTFLLSQSFRRCECDHSIYIFEKEVGWLLIWVDDLILIFPSLNVLNKIKEKLCTEFLMTDLGELKFFLGIQIERNRAARTISLSQETYVKGVLEKFGMTDAKGLTVPMDHSVHLKLSTIADAPSTLSYRSMIGSLMFAMIATRPDLAFAIGVLSRYCNNPDDTHYLAVKRVLRYLLTTQDFALTYQPSLPIMHITGSCDAD